jgi:hypothetical protein
MHPTHSNHAALAAIVGLARALGTAVLSLALGAAVCLGLLLGCTALAG